MSHYDVDTGEWTEVKVSQTVSPAALFSKGLTELENDRTSRGLVNWRPSASRWATVVSHAGWFICRL